MIQLILSGVSLGRLHGGGDIDVHLKDEQESIMWRKGSSVNYFPHTMHAILSIKLLNCWLLGPIPRGARAQESVFNTAL